MFLVLNPPFMFFLLDIPQHGDLYNLVPSLINTSLINCTKCFILNSFPVESSGVV